MSSARSSSPAEVIPQWMRHIRSKVTTVLTSSSSQSFEQVQNTGLSLYQRRFSQLTFVFFILLDAAQGLDVQVLPQAPPQVRVLLLPRELLPGPFSQSGCRHWCNNRLHCVYCGPNESLHFSDLQPRPTHIRWIMMHQTASPHLV